MQQPYSAELTRSHTSDGSLENLIESDGTVSRQQKLPKIFQNSNVLYIKGPAACVPLNRNAEHSVEQPLQVTANRFLDDPPCFGFDPCKKSPQVNDVNELDRHSGRQG